MLNFLESDRKNKRKKEIREQLVRDRDGDREREESTKGKTKLECRTRHTPADEMAFMMPVVKNEWDIYKTNRSRRSSECSNPQACRSRKVST